MSAITKVSNRQREILRLIKLKQLRGEQPPTGTEMMLVSLAVDLDAVKVQLRHMRQLGLLNWQVGGIGFRSLKLTQAGMAVAP